MAFSATGGIGLHPMILGKNIGWRRGEAESITAFQSPVNCIVDELPPNISYIIHVGL